MNLGGDVIQSIAAPMRLSSAAPLFPDEEIEAQRG